MKKSDIAGVLRGQLAKLQSADPVADDFYFQVYNARKGNPLSSLISIIIYININSLIYH